MAFFLSNHSISDACVFFLPLLSALHGFNNDYRCCCGAVCEWCVEEEWWLLLLFAPPPIVPSVVVVVIVAVELLFPIPTSPFASTDGLLSSHETHMKSPNGPTRSRTLDNSSSNELPVPALVVLQTSKLLGSYSKLAEPFLLNRSSLLLLELLLLWLLPMNVPVAWTRCAAAARNFGGIGGGKCGGGEVGGFNGLLMICWTVRSGRGGGESRLWSDSRLEDGNDFSNDLARRNVPLVLLLLLLLSPFVVDVSAVAAVIMPLLLVGWKDSTITFSVPLISHRQKGQLFSPSDFSCHLFKHGRHSKWPHGSSFTFLLRSSQILHISKVVPISQ